ncbi:class Ib ribonucleoside-diphosphate reductase assembly flavoprotein NrdI [Mangrovicoccus ximenensis]|uniref:class Ib ribonucleoside-diphosphate reductase assembly flavoprotein NrdI n=1 Tax=Mangrovicoccus ximenensis TaxID=1911570 RepID=UPI000D371523|nr:class Ib ribonucleoside-diphosphate reductase assembly flavoprotein NrdI [Mangrovicoccus ximenensis]
MAGLVYYSSASGNTARFAARLGRPAVRIPASPGDPMPEAPGPCLLICPTYADGAGRGAVPKQVIRWLNGPARRAALCGVIGTGNRSFGPTFALAGRIIAEKCSVPLVHCLELAGTPDDIARVSAGLDLIEERTCSIPLITA